MEYRYSQLLTLLYVTFMYGAGMPLLYIIALFSLVAIYWVDKITLVRLYRSPPRYSSKLMSRARMWMTPMLLIHICLGFWMFSNSTIFESEDSTLFGHKLGSSSEQWRQKLKWINLGDRIAQVHSFIIFVAIIVLIVIILFKNLIYDFIIKFVLKKLNPNLGHTQTELVLRNYYCGLDQDNFTKEYDKTVAEIRLVKQRILEYKATKEEENLALFKEYKRKLKVKIQDMDGVKTEEKNLIKDHSYDI